MTVSGAFDITNALHLPDSGVWRVGGSTRGESGRGKIGCVAKGGNLYECTQSFDLKASLGRDSLVQDLYLAGVHFASATFVQGEVPSGLTKKRGTLLPLEDNLVQAFMASFTQLHPNGPAPTPVDMLLYYAGRLLIGDSLAGKGLPRGIVADSARKALVQVASERRQSAKVLSAKGLLGLDEPTIRSIMTSLIKEGRLADTTGLYPLPAVRMTEPVKVSGDLVEGEGSVPLSGAFAWNAKGAIRKAEVRIKNSAGFDENVVPNYTKFPDFQSGSWVLTGNVTLQARKGARIGVDTLIAYVYGDSGADTSRTTFNVLAGDRTPPRLSVLSPADGSDLPSTTDRIKVEVEAGDEKGIAEVRIGKVTLTKAPYSTEVDLASGFNFIYVQAQDNSGNVAYDTVVVRRTKSTASVDSTPPQIVLKSPRSDTSVPVGQTGFDLQWTVTDDVAVQKVTLNDLEVTGTAGTYRSSVSLRDGTNAYEIKAFDPTGNVDKKTARITRPADLSKPGVVSPPDQTVGVKDSTIRLSWTITNSRKAKKALLNGSDVPVESLIVRTVPLAPGPNSFTLLVTDEAGGIYTGSVVITRTVEVILPSITPLPDRNVGITDSSTTLTWTILNSAQATGGTLNDQPVVVGSTISQVVSVNPGSNRFVLSLQDAAGKTVTDTVFVIRAADAVGPAIAWVAPSAKTLSVESTVSSYLVQVKATDASGVDSVWIGGVGAKKGGDTWSQTVALPKADGKPVVVPVRARDAYGNMTNDTVTITRAQGDFTPPAITLISPRGDVSVPSGTTEILIEAKATDSGSGVKSFTIAGLDVLATGRLTLGLKVGKNPVVLVATDSAGNADSAKFVVTLIDTTRPVIQLISPTGDQGLGPAFTEYTIKAKATDVGSGLQSFTINGVDVLGTGEITVGLQPGKNPIPLVAVDQAGNRDSMVLNLTVEQYATPPSFLPVGGKYTSSQTVTLQSETPGATFYYTLDGTIPVPGSGAIKYTAPIVVENTQTIKAITVAEGYTNSFTKAELYSIALPAKAPTFSLPAGSYDRVAVALKTASTGASIYYTLDGTVPTSASILYTGDSILIQDSATLKAVAVGENYTASPVSSVSYTVNTEGIIADARDGQVYKTVRIGSQWWMAQNLNFKVDSSWQYMDDADGGEKYGRYYNWAAGMALPQSCNMDFCTDQVAPKHRGVCPSNWHIPTSDETFLLGSIAQAADLRSTTGWKPDYGELIVATNRYGFNAFPTGHRLSNGAGFDRFGLEANWILTDEPSSTSEERFGMRSGVSYVELTHPQTGGKRQGVPIRCIKD